MISEHKVSYRLMNTISIRPERAEEFDEIEHVVEAAFARAEHTDGDVPAGVVRYSETFGL